MRLLKVGLFRMAVQDGDFRRNLGKMEPTIHKHHPDTICFPKLCVRGYDFTEKKGLLNEEKALSALARKYNTAIVTGMNIYEEDKHYDAAGLWPVTSRPM